MSVLATLLLAATPAFWRRETWVSVGVAVGLLFVMDSVMNGLRTFVHTAGVGTGIAVLGLFPLEDIPYALTVILLLIAAPHLWRQARAYGRGDAPGSGSAGPPAGGSGESRAGPGEAGG